MTDFAQPTPKCTICNEVGTVILTENQVARYDRWKKREGFIQDLLPDLDAPQREQLMTGTHPDCWKSQFAEEECDIICDGSSHPGLYCN
jgi:hypothetical protein